MIEARAAGDDVARYHVVTMRASITAVAVLGTALCASVALAQHGRTRRANTREVVLVFRPESVGYSIDGGALVWYGPRDSRRIFLPVGRHTLRIESRDSQCDPITWTQSIAAGREPLTVTRDLRCR